MAGALATQTKRRLDRGHKECTSLMRNNLLLLCQLTEKDEPSVHSLERGMGVALHDPVSTQFGNCEGTAHMAAQQPHDDVLRRVQGEYIEMPGLRLTTAQAQRLWGLDRAACDALLGALVDAKFLFRTRDGAFMRSDQTRAAVG